MIKQIYRIALRECGILRSNPIYAFCMVVFPVLVVVFSWTTGLFSHS